MTYPIRGLPRVLAPDVVGANLHQDSPLAVSELGAAIILPFSISDDSSAPFLHQLVKVGVVQDRHITKDSAVDGHPHCRLRALDLSLERNVSLPFQPRG